VSGLAQTLTVGAILGATYLGNMYQSMNALPNVVFYQLLAGSLFASILVPPLVHHLDAGDRLGVQRIARGFFGPMLMVAAAGSLLLVVAGPLVLHATTSGIDDPTVASAARHVGAMFLMLFAPQVLLYTVAGTGGAVMNAHGRFALAAGAQTIENVAMIATLVIAALMFGVTTVVTVSPQEVLLLGAGTTAAVGLHAGAQWIGARSSGVVLAPTRGWRDPEVREILQRVPAALGTTFFAAIQVVLTLVVADRVRGGFVAFQFALNFFYLPAAIVTWPIARAALPDLARQEASGDHLATRDQLFRATRLATFVTIPAAFAYLALCVPIARGITFGELADPQGVRLVAVSIASIAVAVVGDSAFILATYGCYARRDARTPLRSMALRVAITGACLAASWALALPVLLSLGLSLSAGAVIGAIHLWHAVLRRLPHPTPDAAMNQLRRSLVRTTLAAAGMLLPAGATAVTLSRVVGGQIGETAVLACAGVVGGMTFLAIETYSGGEEFASLREAMRRGGSR
jgi:putative peptidoglycan lipid II flippase